MLTISRKLIQTLRSVFRKVGASADRLRSAVVDFRADGDAVRIQFQCDNLAVEYRLEERQSGVALIVPFTSLAEWEGAKDEPVRVRSENNDVVAEWVDAGVPQQRRYSNPNPTIAWLVPPRSMTPGAPALLTSLADAVESAGEHVKYGTHCIQLRGQRGEVVGTDGRELLIVRGFSFPWEDDILIHRTGLFSCKEIVAAGSLELGRSETHCVLRTGPWTMWLPIEKDLRYPKVDQIVPDPNQATTRLTLDPKDAEFLVTALPRLPGDELDFSPVTLHLNGHVVVRAKGDSGPVNELFLRRSRIEGDEIRVNTNRSYLKRAAALNLLDVRFQKADSPILASDATRAFVWVPLDPKIALGPSADSVCIESSPAAMTHSLSQSIERTHEPMNRINQQMKERESDAETPEETVVDPLQEAEAIKTHLRELLGRTGELVTAIKRQRRQAQLVRTTLASLKQLQEVA